MERFDQGHRGPETGMSSRVQRFWCFLCFYLSFFHSHLLYCATIYSCSSQSNINNLFKQQKKAIRNISGAQYLDHTAPLFEQLKILPLDKVIIHAKATFMHSIYYQYAPNSFTDTWSTLAQLHPEMNLRNSHNFYLSFPRIELFKRPHYTLYLPPGMIWVTSASNLINLSSELSATSSSSTAFSCLIKPSPSPP